MPQFGPSDAVAPRDWGASVDYDRWNDLYVPKDGVALHHGGSGDYPAAQPPYTQDKEMFQLRRWEAYHLSKGWRGLAYGWGVGQSGTIYRIRGWGIYGAHLGDVDGDGITNNREIVPIIWIASGNHHTMSPAADAAIRRLRTFIESHAPSATYLWGHKEIQPKPTACPGPNGMTYVKANRHLEAPTVTVPKSLFIQVRNYQPDLLVAHLEHVRTHHKDRTKPDYIYNVVLDEIGTSVGLHSNLDLIAPYLPGGVFQTFDNVFVGSHYVPFADGGSSYSAGMKSAVHRWTNLKVQKRLWRLFAQKYPDIHVHWYINHEGVLDFFDDDAIRAGYGAFLLQSVRDSHDVAPNRAVMWSPAVWSGVPLTVEEEDAIGRTFASIKRLAGEYGHTRGLGWLQLQDMQGRGRTDISLSDVAQWYRELDAVYDWESLRINMELFNTTPEEVQQREAWYQSHSIPVGASFSLRHWMNNHVEVPA